MKHLSILLLVMALMFAAQGARQFYSDFFAPGEGNVVLTATVD